jgi:oxygen-independent coproporphyrinogen-3 oxidase
MQDEIEKVLDANGYQHYETSAFALPNRRAKHNLNYWQFGDYLGIGAGAHGKLSLALPTKIIRTQKNKHPERYQQANDFIENMIEAADLPLEFLMNQLRLKQGFNLAHYSVATGLDAITLEPALSDCIKAGLLVVHENVYHCSEHGWNFLDDVLQKFLV